MASQQESQLKREAQNPLANGLLGEYFVYQQGRTLCHTPGAAAEAKAASFTAESDYAQTSPEYDNYQMKNPIKPITSRLEKTLKTDVDFKTGKAANNAGTGFVLKIGKFELSRKKGKKKK